MSSVLDERDAYLKSPYFKKHEYSDFSPFYITITICTVIGLTIFLINIFLGCCSRYSEYWNDRHTGNRWIVSLWTATPHQQPSLDYTELQDISIVPEQKIIYQHQHPVVYQHAQGPTVPPEETYELKKRESAI
nr:unnamed protein product [Callosobruchus chinensis]